MSDKDITVLHLSTSSKHEILDITVKVDEVVRARRIQSGLCVVYVPHTTAGITINENADPDVKTDILRALDILVPSNIRYDHSEGNSPAHVMASLCGASQTIFVASGKLLLGTWQGIYFCEFDGPRERKMYVKVLEG
jgi:secondary thiamine-phosphate synthase enzyme